ncbi:MAG: methyltetrahydrofolate cobalamin methyltransferase [Firmicutes bacterium]|nr:methyltetrahydrofolate cobalamin methyltransferase [Bacillota bacterium]
MIVIGEKINGAIPAVGKAIAARDDAFIRDLVKRQVAVGADYLDACAGTAPEEELDALNWLIDIIQEETDTPLCVDSPNARIIEQVLPRVKKCGLINSVSGEGDKCEVIYPLIKDTDWKVVALTCDNDGIPETAAKKVEIAKDLIEKAATYGITPDRIFIDPLVLSLAAVNDCMLSFMDAVKEIKALYPTVNTVSGLSNISYGMPYRKIVNMNFLALALSAGMDAAIIDPENRDMIATVYAVEALMNKDKYCRSYNRAFRQGKFGPAK